MAEIYFRRRGKLLEPADSTSEEVVKKMPHTKIMKCKFTMVRNAAFHRKGFVLLQTLFDMQEHFEQFEPFRKWLVMKAGFFKTIVAPNGYVIYEPESLAWSSMDDLRFQQVYNAVIDTFIAEFSHISKEELEEILTFAE